MSFLRHEWRLLAADRTLTTTAVLLLVLLGLGLFNGWRFARQLAAQGEALATEESARRTRLAQEAEAILARRAPEVPSWKSPTQPFAVGNRLAQPRATLPPGPLNAFSVGQLDLLPVSFQLTLLGRAADSGGETLEHPAHLSTGAFDLGFVLLYLLPLFILGLSFDVLSREREDGTLRLLLVQAAGPRRWVMGRLAVRALMVLGVCALVGGVGLVLSPGMGGGLSWWVWMLLVSLYGTFWFALALAVNVLGRGSATNALVLVGLWLALVVVVPAAAQATVSRLYPAPSRVALVGEVRRASAEATTRGSQLLARYYEDHPELAAGDSQAEANTYLATSIAVQEEAARRTAPVLAGFQTQLAHQQAALGLFRFLSPALAFQQGMHDVTGSGLGRYQHFVRQVEGFQQTWRAALLPRVFAGQSLDARGHQALPRFTYVEEPPREALGRVGGALLALLLPTVAALVFGLWRLRRYPVTG